jgi:2-oxo-4-hydroxy-4-carboxy-5-ureidoimidazoline decarboxylase
MEPWRRLNEASPHDARALLHACCGSTRWVERMLARRPFDSREALLAAARATWFALSPDDWREAFGQHPPIGQPSRFASTRHLSAREQSGAATASAGVRAALAEGNREYERKFGFIFIVCATGKTAEEMLSLLEARLRNDLEAEIRTAAEEQAKITALRLSVDDDSCGAA